MNTFFNHLLQRHTDPGQSIQPRLGSMFESGSPFNPIAEMESEGNEAKQQVEQNDTMKAQFQRKHDLGTKNIETTSILEDPADSKQESIHSSQIILNEKIIRVDSNPAIAQKINSEHKIDHPDVFPNTFENRKADDDDDFENSKEKEIQRILAALRSIKPESPYKKEQMLSEESPGYYPPFEKPIQIEIPDSKLTTLQKNHVPPAIKIHIGKIEIIAEKQQPVHVVKPTATKPALSLDQYLQDRNKKA